MLTLGVHLISHDGGFVVFQDGRLKYIFEAERYFKIKHFRSSEYRSYPFELGQDFIDCIINIDNDFDKVCLCPSNKSFPVHKKLNYKSIIYPHHHVSHASSSYYTSSFEDAIIFSIDGKGSDGCTNIFHAKNNTFKNILNITSVNESFGALYNRFAVKVLSVILNRNNITQLEAPGKFMGYCSFGSYDEKYEAFGKLLINNNGKINNKSCIKLIDLMIDSINNLDDISYTFQRIWINSILELIKKYKHISKNACFVGGCFLNAALNYEIVKTGWFENCHFTPNANDSGLSLGSALSHLKTHIKLPLYPGPKAFDANRLSEFCECYKNQPLDINIVTNMLLDQKIIGVFRGKSEVGPRALGNRSIICDPRSVKMKNHLNQKVKHREWFRPFGVMIKKESLSQFYDIDGDFPYMNIVGFNKTDQLKAVKHVDNSTRIQTVKKSDNEFIYDLLNMFEQATGVPALLNTSFNVNGQPIINWYEDAFNMLEQNKLDALVIEDTIYYRD